MIISYKSTIFVYRLTGIICNVQSIVKLHVMYTWSTCKSRSGIEIIYTFIFDVYLLCRGKKKFLIFFVKKRFQKNVRGQLAGKFDFSCTSSNPPNALHTCNSYIYSAFHVWTKMTFLHLTEGHILGNGIYKWVMLIYNWNYIVLQYSCVSVLDNIHFHILVNIQFNET